MWPYLAVNVESEKAVNWRRLKPSEKDLKKGIGAIFLLVTTWGEGKFVAGVK